VEELTVNDIATILNLKVGTIKMRLHRAGIKPVRMVGSGGLYSLDVVEKIRVVSKGGRPPKNPENKK
jgi:hypothetical protein